MHGIPSSSISQHVNFANQRILPRRHEDSQLMLLANEDFLSVFVAKSIFSKRWQKDFSEYTVSHHNPYPIAANEASSTNCE